LREGALVLLMLLLASGLAVLGRWSAGARVPAVAIGNLLGGMVMLALSWKLALPERAGGDAFARRWAWAAMAVLLAQVAAGALVSASYAGLSCASFADCWRNAEAAGLPWRALNPWREPAVVVTAMPINAEGALAQVVHRSAALVVLLVVARLGIAAVRGGRPGTGAALLALLALQLALGWLMVAALLPLPLALAHNVVAGLLLATAGRLA
jgi:heme a synthase